MLPWAGWRYHHRQFEAVWEPDRDFLPVMAYES
jgi:hypothetical protein